MHLRFVKWAGLCALFALAVPAHTIAQPNPEIQKAALEAWKSGRIYVPAELSTTGKLCESAPGGPCEKTIKEGKHPVILFLHGCDGPRNPATFIGHGAVVVAPRSSRGANTCNLDPQSFGRTILQRRVDALISFTQLKEMPWANPDKVILAGFSQGARVAALYVRDDFFARIIIAWTCNNPRNADQNGIRGKGPALAVLGAADDFLKKQGVTGTCEEAVASRGGASKSVLIQGGSHQILDHPQTRLAVKEFLADVLK